MVILHISKLSSNPPCLVYVAHRDGREGDLCLMGDVGAGDDVILVKFVEHFPYPVDGRSCKNGEHSQPQDRANPRFALKFRTYRGYTVMPTFRVDKFFSSHLSNLKY